MWRHLMAIGMFIHRLHPKTVAPRFIKYIPSTLSGIPGHIKLVFYTPNNYGTPDSKGKQYPVLLNFHGGGFYPCLLLSVYRLTFGRLGGFTIGSATDDARWATAVVKLTGSIVCSVDYRLAPEHPHPTAVDDGADAALYLYEHADDLGIDREKIGTSGFSAGGNLAITVPIRLQDTLMQRHNGPGSVTSLVYGDGGSISKKRAQEEEPPIIKIVVAWYPKTDFSQPPLPTQWPDKELPQFFVKLFDASYLQQPIDLSSPYLSPAVASDDVLRTSLPRDVLLYTTEWDSLYAEGERLRERLRALGGVIDVQGKMITSKRHGWDRSPNVFKEDLVAQEVYAEACIAVRRVFYGEEGSQSEGSTDAKPSALKNNQAKVADLIDFAAST
ncbi:hypothetical protein FRB94_005634 [Tulasnella sp. JGI-2019a]|nr:hypothetical protein FRB94_005634 [Tulasnella sp. JGI-2019a]